MNTISRRTFVSRALAGVGTAVFGSRAGALPENSPAMRYAMCNETFAKWPQQKIFTFLVECGYTGVEIAPFTIANDVTTIDSAERTRLRKAAESAGIRIIGLHWLLAKTRGLHLTSLDATVRDRTADYLVELGKFCSDLGGDLLVFGSPRQRNLLPGVTRDQAMDSATEVFRSIMPQFEKLGIVLALEPLAPGTTSFIRTAAEGVALIERVDSPNCKLHLDCNAMSTESTPIPELIRKYARWLVHFHANDPNSQGPGMGELDFGPIFQALRDIRYGGWVSVEVFDTSPGPEQIARASIAYMKRIQAQLN